MLKIFKSISVSKIERASHNQNFWCDLGHKKDLTSYKHSLQVLQLLFA